MLKRLCIWVLLPLYLITASGFAISLHYCGQLLTGFELNAPAKKCVTLAKLKCCKDKEIIVKVKDAHQSAEFNFNANNIVADVPQHFITLSFFTFDVNPGKIYFNKAPPDIVSNAVPAFIQNCTFRI